MNREEIISYCLTYKNAYQNIPFRDHTASWLSAIGETVRSLHGFLKKPKGPM